MIPVELPLTLTTRHPTAIPVHHTITAGVAAFVECHNPMRINLKIEPTPEQVEAIGKALDYLVRHHPITSRLAPDNDTCMALHEEHLNDWATPIWRAHAIATLERWGIAAPTQLEPMFLIVRAINTAREVSKLSEDSIAWNILREALGADTHYLLETLGMPKGPTTAVAHNRNPDTWAKHPWLQLAEHVAERFDN
jgi:hypothetical protein